MEPGDAELVAKWLDDFEAKAKRMADDSFGVAGVGRELEVIAALRRLLLGVWQPLLTAPRDKTRFVVWHKDTLEVGWVERWRGGEFLFLDRWRDASGPFPLCQVDEDAAALVLWTLPKPPMQSPTGGRWIDMPHVSMEDAAAFAASLRSQGQECLHEPAVINSTDQQHPLAVNPVCRRCCKAIAWDASAGKFALKA